LEGGGGSEETNNVSFSLSFKPLSMQDKGAQEYSEMIYLTAVTPPPMKVLVIIKRCRVAKALKLSFRKQSIYLHHDLGFFAPLPPHLLHL
jgi:hypothetical protein